MIRRSVDFPHPLGPTKAANVPAGTSTLTSRSASTVPRADRKTLDTLLTRRWAEWGAPGAASSCCPSASRFTGCMSSPKLADDSRGSGHPPPGHLAGSCRLSLLELVRLRERDDLVLVEVVDLLDEVVRV